MKHVLVTIALLFLCAGVTDAVGVYPRTMFVTFEKTPMYDSASYLSTILLTLHRGDSVQATGSSGKFLHVMVEGKEGFLLSANASSERPRGTASGRSGAEAGAGRTGDSASREGGSTPPSSAGRSAKERKSGAEKQTSGTETRCRAITKAGTQCSRMTEDPSGFCWQHKK